MVTIPNPAVVVTVTASIQKGAATAITRTFEVVVGQLENTTMAALLTKSAGNVAYSEGEVVYLAADKRTAVLADATGYGYIFNSVALDITLGQFIGASYTVGLFRGLIQMTAVKLVTPKGTDPNITPVAQVMTATQALPYTSAAVWSPALVTMELVGYASGNFTNGYLAGFGTNFIQTNNAPTTLRDKKFTVTGWLTGRGSTTPAQSLTLISILDYATVVAAATDPTDAEKLALSVERFVAPAANNALTANLTLPTTATYGTVTWTSDTPSVISNTGVVSRPAIGQPDMPVKLTYVITVGSNSTQPVEVLFIVKAQEPVSNQFATDLFINFYMEGSTGNRKAIAVFNNTGATVDLTQYKIGSINNPSAIDANNVAGPTLTGTLEQGKSLIIYHADMTSTATPSPNGYMADFKTMIDTLPSGNRAITNAFQFNGERGDFIAISKLTSTPNVYALVDVIGEFNAQIGSGSAAWETSYTKDKSLFRKSSVVNPRATVDWTEWEVAAVHTFDSRVYTWR